MPRYDLNGNELPDEPGMTAVSAPPPVATQYDLAGNPLPAQPMQQQPPSAQQTSYTQQLQAQRQPTTYFDGKQIRFTDESSQVPENLPMRWAAASAIALVTGIIGAIGIMKLVETLGHYPVAKLFMLLNIGLGALVGWIVKQGPAKGGAIPAAASAGILVLCLLIGHAVYASDYGVSLVEVAGMLTIFHWLGIGGGIFACARVASTD